jgi:hypothetical protein
MSLSRIDLSRLILIPDAPTKLHRFDGLGGWVEGWVCCTLLSVSWSDSPPRSESEPPSGSPQERIIHDGLDLTMAGTC